MAKFELSLGEDYVAHWGVVDAVREIFQNALDQQTVCKENIMFFEYDEAQTKLRIGNKDSVLDAKTLLLGVTTKSNDDSTIGQFGEGYKIALLVLARLNKKVTIFNYGKREVWKARLSKSKKYDGAKILVIDTDTKYFWQVVPDNNLMFEIEGVTSEEYQQIVESNLHLQETIIDLFESMYGRILLEPKYKSKIYVNGLFISNAKDFQYGYDLIPKYIKLDRDRRLVPDFDLKWATSQMWTRSHSDRIVTLAKQNAPDVSYISSQGSYFGGSSGSSEVYNSSYSDFAEEYGEKAVPVTNQMDYDITLTKYGGAENVRPVIVTEASKHLITNSSDYKAASTLIVAIPPKPTPFEEMQDFWETYSGCGLPDDVMEHFERLLEASKEWRNKL